MQIASVFICGVLSLNLAKYFLKLCVLLLHCVFLFMAVAMRCSALELNVTVIQEDDLILCPEEIEY